MNSKIDEIFPSSNSLKVNKFFWWKLVKNVPIFVVKFEFGKFSICRVETEENALFKFEFATIFSSFQLICLKFDFLSGMVFCFIVDFINPFD